MTMPLAQINSSDPFLMLGDSRRGEFAPARASLERLGRVVDARSVDEAVALLDEGAMAPAVVVVAQSYPGEFSADAIDRIRRAAPLARIVGLLGSWCEGETRSGHPWPGVIRLYWHQWRPQAERELARLIADGGSTWSLPSTATDEERLLARTPEAADANSLDVEGGLGLVALCADRADIHDWLSAALVRRGYSTAWLRPGEPVRLQGVRAAVFDAGLADRHETISLHELAVKLGPRVPIVALADFPRIENHDRLLAAGASAVLSKPLLLDDLFWELRLIYHERHEKHENA
ncbi:MAG TPA: hypothetical protein VJL29_09670 [Thermoguttaceae bacterium]|nr:hypothetical protein [Thermoguttaceae bacterium]